MDYRYNLGWNHHYPIVSNVLAQSNPFNEPTIQIETFGGENNQDMQAGVWKEAEVKELSYLKRCPSIIHTAHLVGYLD